ncbi:BMP family protein [Kineosporia sp. A_224]|uniref:BMP family lipoprotein n=1 Tax=Kineosporia sp. A_224 TaxID=1962180 RepID=UPI0018E9B7B4|nr:BMP family ABC transporter substrate-binding protein [Kineosporia sp. A_224]
MTKLAAVVATAALALAACGSTSSAGGGTTTESGSPAATTSSAAALKVGLAYDIGGRGDKSFNDAAAAGLDKAKAELGVEIKELSATQGETDADKEARLTLLAQAGYNPVIAVGFLYGTALKNVSAKFPNTQFGIIDSTVDGATNVTGLVFAENEGSFLVGAAAALKSKSGNVGYIGGCLIPLLQKFEAGFTAGAKAVKPDIKVQVKYLSNPPDCKGFNDPAAGTETANGMYDAGADIIFAAAGGSGTGVFQSAKAKKALAIGVDSDQYQTAAADLQPVIMTSMLKRVDVAVFDFIKSFKDGAPLTGVQVFDLKKDGVGYSTSGGQVDDIATKLDEYKAKIVSGEIKVPAEPAK